RRQGAPCSTHPLSIVVAAVFSSFILWLKSKLHDVAGAVNESKLFEYCLVDVDTQAVSFGRLHMARPIDAESGAEHIPEGVVMGNTSLEVAGIIDGRQHVQAGRMVDTRC